MSDWQWLVRQESVWKRFGKVSVCLEEVSYVVVCLKKGQVRLGRRLSRRFQVRWTSDWKRLSLVGVCLEEVRSGTRLSRRGQDRSRIGQQVFGCIDRHQTVLYRSMCVMKLLEDCFSSEICPNYSNVLKLKYYGVIIHNFNYMIILWVNSNKKRCQRLLPCKKRH